MTSSSSGPLRIGVLGAARIARLFVEAVRPSAKVVVTAVASRGVERATAFARELGIARVHASYDALFADPDIDAVYVPLPNNLHAQWSIRAASAGKHVLCEKPLAANAAEARAMFESAENNDVYLVEAYPYRAQPQTLKVRELIAVGAIGRIQLIQASFGFPLTDAANIRMDPKLAGGALMDAGSYPVSFVRTVAGAASSRALALSRWAIRVSMWPRWLRSSTRMVFSRRSRVASPPRGTDTRSLPATQVRSTPPISTIPALTFGRSWTCAAVADGMRRTK